MIMSTLFGAAQAQGTWSTARLSVARCCLAATSLGNVSFFAGGLAGGGSFTGPSRAVDIYDSGTNTWLTAQLSVARAYLAATSVGNVAIFAGGINGTWICKLVQAIGDE